MADDVLISKPKAQAILPEELEVLLGPLNALVGLETVKKEGAYFIHFLHVRMIREEGGLGMHG